MKTVLYLGNIVFINSSMYRCGVCDEQVQNPGIHAMCGAYIVQNLLAATSTASMKALIAPVVVYAGVCALG